MNVTWTILKTQADSRGTPLQYIEETDYYRIYLFDQSYTLETKLDRDPTDTTDLLDFETNYKPVSNTSHTDTDGAVISRLKAAKKGWTYHLSGIEFETSLLNSVYQVDYENNTLSESTIKFYDSNDIELTTQGDLDTSCVKTVLDFEPTYDYEIIGGTIKAVASVASDYRVWVVAVPDLTPAQGGSKVMVNNINLKFVDPNNGVEADGRVSKYMTYNATYHTSKLRLIVRHPAGGKEKLMIAFEMFKV